MTLPYIFISKKRKKLLTFLRLSAIILQYGYL